MKFRDALRLSALTGGAALIVAVAYFGAFLISFGLTHPLSGTIGGAVALSVLAIAIGLTSWRLHIKLRADFGRREARAITIAFAMCIPVSLAIAFLLYAVPGTIASPLMPKSRFGFLIVLFVGIAIIAALLTVLLCALALWVTRRTVKAESDDQRAQIDNSAG